MLGWVTTYEYTCCNKLFFFFFSHPFSRQACRTPALCNVVSSTCIYHQFVYHFALSVFTRIYLQYHWRNVPRSPFPVPRSPFPVPRSPFPVPRSPFPVPRSPFPVPRSPFPVPRSPFPVPRSPFPVPRSPFPVLRSPFPVPRSPCPVPRAPCPVPSQLYHHEAESTLKNKFCATCGAQDKENRRFPRASRKRTRNGRAGVETKLYVFVTSYLASSFALPYNFIEIIGFVSRVSWRLLTSRCIK